MAVANRSHQASQIWNLPNVLTMSRIVMVPLFLWAFLTQGGENTTLRWVAAIIFAVATATDWLDGDIARRRNIVTDFGKIADPIADKALMGAALIGLSYLGELAWWVTIVILIREIGITVMRFVVIRRQVLAASRGGKLKTALQGLGLLLLILPLTGFLHGVGMTVMYAALVVTVVTGIDYAMQVARWGPKK
ncbi:CDP-diacylglycerol--glycerol-3-phosphate 3-phosphatidyltransferase [Ornithinimicrobium sp. Arc0846-15]|nr:CDP-diacylglycerol--glycerol-3-phosphate 3-phosphatidyltransferase [Ornithinimicrobium laminariae]